MASLDLYEITVPRLSRSLESLSKILSKAVDQASSKNLPVEDIPKLRIIEDMHPLTFQVQTACNTAKFIAVRVGGVSNVVQEDNETTVEQLQARIATTVEFLKGVDKAAFAGKEEAEVEFRGLKFTGSSYVLDFAIPNFYFHVTAAYAILRMKGIDIGKMDFLGRA